MVVRRKTETVPVKFEMVTLLFVALKEQVKQGLEPELGKREAELGKREGKRNWGKGKRNWDQCLKEQVLTTLELCTACIDSSILVMCRQHHRNSYHVGAVCRLLFPFVKYLTTTLAKRSNLKCEWMVTRDGDTRRLLFSTGSRTGALG
jgi:hypothetical protein